MVAPGKGRNYKSEYGYTHTEELEKVYKLKYQLEKLHLHLFYTDLKKTMWSLIYHTHMHAPAVSALKFVCVECRNTQPMENIKIK